MYGSGGSYGSPLDKHVRVTFHLIQVMIFPTNELTWICHDLIRPTCENFPFRTVLKSDLAIGKLHSTVVVASNSSIM